MKVRLVVTESRCRCGLMKNGDAFEVGDACPPICHELWHQIYPQVYVLQNGGDLDAGEIRAKSFDAECPDGGRVHIHGEVMHEKPRERSTESEQVLRIREMEQALNKAAPALQVLQETLPKLTAYYQSPLWMEDYDADGAGKLPDDLRRGVLSQDAVYDLLEKWNELKEKMKTSDEE